MIHMTLMIKMAESRIMAAEIKFMRKTADYNHLGYKMN
jgi:hypothetical protein